jgi:hypothetical protein
MEARMLIDSSQLTVTDSESILGFETEGGGSWKVWDRYLTIDGKKAFHIGNVCGTCSFFFERLEGANQSINAPDAIEKLNSGLGSLDPSVVKALSCIIPDGVYGVLFQRVYPTLVQPGAKDDYFGKEQVALWGIEPFWGMPHFPKTEYYRLMTKTIKKDCGLFEFLVPTFPHNWLNEQRLADYRTDLNKGVQPTSVAISVLDVKGPADWDGEPEVTSHWCLAQYLIDGHHKVYAASRSNRPLTLISFLALEQGVSSKQEINELLEILGV